MTSDKPQRHIYMLEYRIESKHFDKNTGKVIHPKLTMLNPKTGQQEDCAKLFPIFFSNLQKAYEWVVKDFAAQFKIPENKSIYYEKARRSMLRHGQFILTFHFALEQGQFDLKFTIKKHLVQ